MKRYTYTMSWVLSPLLGVGCCWESGAGIVTAGEPKSQAAAHTNQAKANAVGGLLGKLSTLDRQGKPGELKLAPDGVERFYLEGGTAAVAIWTFEGTAKHTFFRRLLRMGLPVTMDFKAFRPPYRPLPDGVIISISVKNPRTGARSEVKIERPRSSAVATYIPHQIAGRRGHTFELFRDFVAEGSIDILVRGLEPGVYLGVRERDLRLLDPGKRPAGGRVPSKATEETALGKRESPSAPGNAYARAIAACRSGWAEYERAIFEFTEGHTKRQGIFLEDEVRIADELHGVLKQCLADMQPRLQEANDGKPWFQAAIVHLLLGQDADALGCFTKAAKLGQSYRGVYHVFRGRQHYAKAELLKAYKDLSEAIRLDPEKAYAYVLRSRIAEVMEQPQEEDREKARQLDPKVDSPRRTLPWRTVYPLDESLRELGKRIPRKELIAEPF